jgi:hypothetical protein
MPQSDRYLTMKHRLHVRLPGRRIEALLDADAWAILKTHCPKGYGLGVLLSQVIFEWDAQRQQQEGTQAEKNTSKLSASS